MKRAVRVLVMATLDESATATLSQSFTAGTVIEQNMLRLSAAVTLDDSRGATVTSGDRVRRRLAMCFFLHIAGVAIVTQVYPRVRL